MGWSSREVLEYWGRARRVTRVGGGSTGLSEEIRDGVELEGTEGGVGILGWSSRAQREALEYWGGARGHRGRRWNTGVELEGTEGGVGIPG